MDRTIYNVERDMSLAGGTAIDALRRVPILSVDIDGNVTLRGSANIIILINGKPSTITANNLADALKQIPVDEIKSVEVITSPSAKYDADGSAGMINIVLRQDRLHGVLLNPDMAFGTRASFLGINGGYNNKNMSFSVGGFGRVSYNVNGIYANLQTVGSSDISQQAATRKADLADNYHAGWEYDMDKFNFLTASLRYSQSNNHLHQDNLLSSFYTGSGPDSLQLNQVATTNRSATVDATIDYTHAFKNPQREFSLLTLFSRTAGSSAFTNIQQNPSDDALINGKTNSDASSNQEVTLQADYQTPVDSNQLLEFGGKYIIRGVVSNYNYLSAMGSNPPVTETSPYLTNRFSYHQNVTAGYLEYTLNTRLPLSFRVGARYEYTAISAGLLDAGVTLPSIRSYGVFVPAVNLGWRLDNGRIITWGFSRRIQRPSIQYLNPNLVAADPGNISTGNPALGPEYSNNFELGYNTAIGSLAVGFSGFYRQTTNSIASVSLPTAGGDTIERTYANVGRESTGGMNLFANLDAGQNLSLSGGLNIYYTELKNAGLSQGAGNPGPAGRNSGWILSANLSGGYNFAKKWSLYLFSYYRGSQVLLQGYQTGFPYYSLTLKRSLPKKLGTVGIGAENF
ncbi:MAG TPA: TonB-dependent receptor, partial [Puia sp.]|nr:TonB-dependent receptor [Puia sp.]